MKEKIWQEGRHAPGGRRGLAQQTGSRSEMAPPPEEAGSFEGLLAAWLQQADVLGDEALAFYLITRRLSRHPVPPSLKGAFSWMEAQREADPGLQARCDRIEREIAALVAGHDAAAQFERLTGRRIDPVHDRLRRKP